MDKPIAPFGPNASNSPWPEDSGSGQDFGATGIFGTLSAPDPAKDQADLGVATDPLAKWITEAAKPQAAAPAPQYVPTAAPVPQTPSAPKGFAEPVVHKVVFGGGAAESSPQLLDRMRAASAERAVAENAPAAEVGSKGSGGFTELLRTLETEPPATHVAPKEMPRAAQDSGFTSLLRTLGTPEGAGPVETPSRPVQPAAPAPGGFTELFRATTPDEPEFGGLQAKGGGSRPGESDPGAFTKLFGTLGGAESSHAAPAPETFGASQSSPGSFTRMLSVEQQSAPVAPAYQEERRPLPGPVDYGVAPRAASPAASSDPFASAPLPEATPSQSASGGSGMGITRLIQMLDEPSRAATPHFEPVPVSSPPGPEPGVWTQTFASLAQSNEPAAPAKTPDWSTPPAPPAVTDFPAAPIAPVAHEAAFNKPVVPSAASGPSEFTRILDASKMRELSMKGGAAANPAPAATSPQSFAPAPPQVPMPNFQMPMAPPQVPMHGGGGMPQSGGFTPPQAPQAPSYPMNFGPQAGGTPAMGGGMPQVPAVQAPPIPQAPPVKLPDAAAGKTQQLLIVMGVVIIVLLVAILVTVIFLMKH